MINKATYDPELDQQIAKETAAARDARTAARNAVASATTQNTELVQNAALTPQGSTLALAEFTEINDWLESNATAKSVDILDKIQKFKDGRKTK